MLYMEFMSKQHHCYCLNKISQNIIVCLFIFVDVSKTRGQSLADKNGLNKSVSAIFVFGDSTSDPGNNNFIRTPFKSNFPPYGNDFTNRTPTGRFTNGLLATDFIARYYGVKDYVPPYLDPSLSTEELMTGVSFASAGSGFDPLTPKISNVISLSKQLKYFKEYRKRLEVAVGKERTKQVIRNALFIISAGTNDLVVNYYTVPIRRRSYNLSSYMDFLFKQEHHFIKELWKGGARRMGVAGMTPIGCLPIIITLYANNPITNRTCVEYFSSTARDYNNRLQNLLNSLHFSLAYSGLRIAYLDTYTTMQHILMNSKSEFEVVDRGCCGTGVIEAAFICNRASLICPNASNFVYWDSIHPTQTVYYLAAQAFQPTLDSLIVQ